MGRGRLAPTSPRLSYSRSFGCQTKRATMRSRAAMVLATMARPSRPVSRRRSPARSRAVAEAVTLRLSQRFVAGGCDVDSAGDFSLVGTSVTSLLPGPHPLAEVATGWPLRRINAGNVNRSRPRATRDGRHSWLFRDTFSVPETPRGVPHCFPWSEARLMFCGVSRRETRASCTHRCVPISFGVVSWAAATLVDSDQPAELAHRNAKHSE